MLIREVSVLIGVLKGVFMSFVVMLVNISKIVLSMVE